VKPDLEITLLPAPDDQSRFAPEYQHGLRAFEKALSGQGISIDARPALAKMAGGPFLSGDFVLKLAGIVSESPGAWPDS
jgi:hypothetical protein